MNILLIEDEEATARKLQRMLAEVEPTATVVGRLGSVEESVAWLTRQPAPDLILLDIELADGQSFEIFNQVTVTSPVIFTTAYDEYAIRAFRVNSIDYLLKPVKEDDLRNALTKLRTMKQALTNQSDGLRTALTGLLQQLQPSRNPALSEETSFKERFLVKQGQRLIPVSIDEIVYFFSRKKMTFIKTCDAREWLIDYTMDEVEGVLDPKRYFRINRQIIAQLRAIERVSVYFNGKLKVTLTPSFDEEVLVSRDKSPDFKRWLGE